MESQLLRPHPEGEDDDVAVVRFAGTKVSLDEETTHSIRDQLFAIAEELSQVQLILDFGNVKYVSSTALGTLVNLHKRLIADGRCLTVDNLCSQVYEVFAVTRLDELLDLRPAKAQAQPHPEGRQDSSPAGVLVVDDEAAVLSVLKVGLLRGGFRIWLAGHGRQAIKLYRRHLQAIAVVQLDVLMPGMDGPHTLRALQKLCPAVRCCFMTGNPKPSPCSPSLPRVSSPAKRTVTDLAPAPCTLWGRNLGQEAPTVTPDPRPRHCPLHAVRRGLEATVSGWTPLNTNSVPQLRR